MSWYTRPVGDVETRITCDTKGCAAHIAACRSEEYGPDGSAAVVRRAAERSGWTAWASRTRRYYCGEHGPKPGHAMYQVSL